MATPIALIVAADEPALFFSSVAAAEQYLEPISVEHGVYRAAYGPNGAPYRIEVQSGRVTIAADVTRQPEPDALKTLLLEFLSAIDAPGRPHDDVSTLLDLCMPHLSA